MFAEGSGARRDFDQQRGSQVPFSVTQYGVDRSWPTDYKILLIAHAGSGVFYQRRGITWLIRQALAESCRLS